MTSRNSNLQVERKKKKERKEMRALGEQDESTCGGAAVLSGCCDVLSNSALCSKDKSFYNCFFFFKVFPVDKVLGRK